MGQVAFAGKADLHLSARIRIFHGVLYQIVEDLFHLDRVHLGFQGILARVKVDLYAFHVGWDAVELHRSPRQEDQVRDFRSQRQLFGLDG